MGSKVSIIGMLLCAASFAETTLFEKIGDNFQSAAAPVSKEVAGYWAGRCVTEADPNRLFAAVLVHKVVKDEAQFPPVRSSLSYFFDKNAAVTTFDGLIANQIESYPSVSTWFAKEQWQKAALENDALTNYYKVSDSVRLRRALKVLDTQFERVLVLQVSRLQVTSEGEKASVATNCYFNNFRGKNLLAEPPPTEDVVTDLGAIGPVHNQLVGFANPRPNVVLKWFELRNAGTTEIELRDLQWTDAFGGRVADMQRHVLAPGVAMRFSVIGAQYFTVNRVSVFVAGHTPRLEIRSALFTTPSKP